MNEAVSSSSSGKREEDVLSSSHQLLPEDQQAITYIWSKILSHTTSEEQAHLHVSSICFEWRSLESISLIYQEEAIAAVIATLPIYTLQCYIRDLYQRYVHSHTLHVNTHEIAYHILTWISLSIHQFHGYSQASLPLNPNQASLPLNPNIRTVSHNHQPSSRTPSTNTFTSSQFSRHTTTTTNSHYLSTLSQPQQRTYSNTQNYNLSTLLLQQVKKTEIITTWLQYSPLFDILQWYLTLTWEEYQSQATTIITEEEKNVFLQVKKLVFDLTFVMVHESFQWQEMAFGYATIRTLDLTQKQLILLFLQLIEGFMVSIPPCYPFMPKELYEAVRIPPKNGLEICTKKIRSLFVYSRYHQSIQVHNLTASDLERIEEVGKRHPWKKMLSIVQLLQLVSVVKTRTCVNRPSSPLSEDLSEDELSTTTAAIPIPEAHSNSSQKYKEDQVLEVVKTGRFLSFDDDDDQSLSNYSMSGSLNLGPLSHVLPPAATSSGAAAGGVRTQSIVEVEGESSDKTAAATTATAATAAGPPVVVPIPRVRSASIGSNRGQNRSPAPATPTKQTSTDTTRITPTKQIVTSPTSATSTRTSSSSSISEPTPGPNASTGFGYNKEDEMLFTAFEEVFRHIAAVDKALLIKEKQVNVTYRNANHCYLCNQFVKGLMEKYFKSSSSAAGASSNLQATGTNLPDHSPMNTTSASMYVPNLNTEDKTNNTSSRRRHHCRICAETICQACSVTSGLTSYYDFQASDDLMADLEGTTTHSNGGNSGTNSRKHSGNNQSSNGASSASRPSSRRNSGSARRESQGSIGFLGDGPNSFAAAANRRESLLNGKDGNGKKHNKDRACLICAVTIEQFLMPILQTTPSAYEYDDSEKEAANVNEASAAKGGWFSSNRRQSSGSTTGNTLENATIHDKRVLCQCRVCLAQSIATTTNNNEADVLSDAFLTWHKHEENLEDISFGGVWKEYKDDEDEVI